MRIFCGELLIEEDGMLVRFGTEELFKEESGKEDEAIHYDNQAIEELLDRSKEGIEQKENWANEYLSSFKVASYVTKEGEEVSVLDLGSCYIYAEIIFYVYAVILRCFYSHTHIMILFSTCMYSILYLDLR